MTNLTDSERLVAFAGGVLVVVGTVVQIYREFWDVKPKPDPWGPEVEEQLNDPELQPVCLHCSTPHPDTAWFCPECGAAVGDYNNLNPYLQFFSLGEVLRTGTSGKFPRSWVTLIGYTLLSTAEYLVFAPVYWFEFLTHLREPQPEVPAVPPPPAVASHS